MAEETYLDENKKYIIYTWASIYNINGKVYNINGKVLYSSCCYIVGATHALRHKSSH